MQHLYHALVCIKNRSVSYFSQVEKYDEALLEFAKLREKRMEDWAWEALAFYNISDYANSLIGTVSIISLNTAISIAF